MNGWLRGGRARPLHLEPLTLSRGRSLAHGGTALAGSSPDILSCFEMWGGTAAGKARVQATHRLFPGLWPQSHSTRGRHPKVEPALGLREAVITHQ